MSLDDSPVPPVMQRSRGRADVTVKADQTGRSRLADLSQLANAKLRFPGQLPGKRAVEAVMINTAGGLTGGDTLDWSVTARDGAACTVTSQACERVYDCAGADCVTSINLCAGSDSAVTWLPQEMMLFEGARMRRIMRADLAGSARLAVFDAFILGREHMGETLSNFAFRDSWRIMRDGDLLFADETRLDADAAARGLGPDYRVFGTFVLCQPMGEEQAVADAARLRALCARQRGDSGKTDRFRMGVSARSGLITGRFAAGSAYVMRRALAPALEHLCGPADLPMIWRT